MSEPNLKCPKCQAESVVEWEGVMNCRACGYSFQKGAAALLTGEQVDERIKQAVAEALKGADARAKIIATEATTKAITNVTAGLMKQYREKGENYILTGYGNLMVGAVAAFIGVAVYNSDPDHPSACFYIPVFFLVIGAAIHKRGKELLALADQHNREHPPK